MSYNILETADEALLKAYATNLSTTIKKGFNTVIYARKGNNALNGE